MGRSGGKRQSWDPGTDVLGEGEQGQIQLGGRREVGSSMRPFSVPSGRNKLNHVAPAQKKNAVEVLVVRRTLRHVCVDVQTCNTHVFVSVENSEERHSASRPQTLRPPRIRLAPVRSRWW